MIKDIIDHYCPVRFPSGGNNKIECLTDVRKKIDRLLSSKKGFGKHAGFDRGTNIYKKY